jgi:hypothetical protein
MILFPTFLINFYSQGILRISHVHSDTLNLMEVEHIQ